MEIATKWTGVGRWMSFIGGTLLAISAIPFVFSHGQQMAAGWSIFLGLLLIGSVAAGSKTASKIAILTAALLLLRVILVPVLGGGTFDFFYSLVPLAFVAWAAVDLRSQSSST